VLLLLLLLLLVLVLLVAVHCCVAAVGQLRASQGSSTNLQASCTWPSKHS
jgi:hypothetical protein